MTSRVYTDYIRDVIEALEKCLKFTEGMQFSGFDSHNDYGIFFSPDVKAEVLT